MSNDKQRWAEIDSIIAENKAELKAAKDHDELKSFASSQGWMNANDFPKFKHSLAKIGVFYEELRAAAFAARDAEKAETLAALGDDAPCVRLWVAASEAEDSSSASFAVVSDDHDAVWYGSFFDSDRVRVPGDLVSAEQSVAGKAVWLVGKALEAAGHELGRAEIVTTCPDLDVAALKTSGARFGVAVDIVVDDDERAIIMSETPGFSRWQDYDLTSLVEVEED
ncbi:MULTISPECIES: hypothetical protein [Corynebacterium]|uniref:hypothetical protein n=1 Tax=Corynebacterium TaxID=1716 RepID=UPI00124BE6D9|nr:MULTISPECIES: hypothetical protein [Corynebacterium]